MWKRSAREASFTVSFTLGKKDYASILDRIKDGNAVLNTLASQSRALEPTRRSGSQAKLALLTRKLSQSIFMALQSAIKCKCSSHDLGLDIAPRKDRIVSGNDEDQAARSLHFDIFVGGYGRGQTQHWDRVRVRLAEEDGPPDLSKSVCPPNTHQLPPPSKKVKFASFLTSHISNRNTFAASGVSQSSLQPPSTCRSIPFPSNPIRNLCQLLQKGKGPASDCYGFIADTSRKFNLHTEDGQLEDYTTVNLRERLEGRKQGPRRFEYPETLKVALALSFSVLHYYNTPWLAKIVTTEHVAFLCEEKAPDASADYMDRPFLAKQMFSSSACASSIGPTKQPSPTTTRPVNLTLLSLGFLLIQIILGRTVEDLQIKDDADMKYFLEKQATASQLNGSGEMLINGGPNYAAAVQWCLDNFFNGASFEDEAFCYEFYGEVIARLETDAKHQYLGF